MSTNNTVYIISANDAALHLGKIKEILEGFKKENRIADHVEWASEKTNEASFQSVKPQDMIILLLTEGISSQKVKLEQQMLQLKKDQPQTTIVEIIINNLAYEKTFIPLPTNLRPINDRTYLNTVWEEIGKSLRDMLPMKKKLKHKVEHNKWSKYLKVASVRLLLLAAFFIFTGMIIKDTESPENLIKESISEDASIKVISLDTKDYEVSITSLSPSSPSTLRTGEKVLYKFKYDVNEPGGVRIYGRPMTNGESTSGYGVNGAPISPTGKGTGSGYFTINSGNQTVDQLRIQIWSADQTKMLYEAFFPVNFRFRSEANNSDNLSVTGLSSSADHKVSIPSFSPSSPSTLRTGEKVLFKFKYDVNEPGGVRIYGRPMTKGKTTPDYGAHGASILPTGKGTGTGDFTIKSGNQTVDQLRIQIWSADQTKMLHEAFFPVNFRFRSEANNSDNLSATDSNNLRVTGLTASVSPNNVSGECPKIFDFTGKITVDKPGTVSYTWLRSDNASGPIKTLKFTEAGTKTVNTNWTLGGSGKSYPNFWQQLKIVNPEEKLSNKASFSLTCEPDGLANEDCLSVNNKNLSILSNNDKFTVTDGRSSMMAFRTRHKAQMAIDVIKYYKLDTRCFAVRPMPGLSYFKVDNELPSGNFPGEDCVPIKDLGNLKIVKKSDNLYIINEGSHSLFSAKSLKEV